MGKLRSLSSKYSVFTSILLLWVVATSLWWDIHLHTFNWTKGIVLCGIVDLVERGFLLSLSGHRAPF